MRTKTHTIREEEGIRRTAIKPFQLASFAFVVFSGRPELAPELRPLNESPVCQGFAA